jgi:cytochrome c oxidase cbb3-type subunit 3
VIRRGSRPLAFGLLLLATTGARPAWESSEAGDPTAGRNVFEQHCLSCHGAQGRGDGPEAPFLSPRPASLISAATSVKSDKELLALIANGKPRTSMPAWKDRLTEAQQRDVLAYLRSLVRFYKPGTPAPRPPDQSN